MVLLNVMRGSGISESSGNSCCVPAFHEWRMNIDGKCS